MGFWDKVKAFFGGGGPAEHEHTGAVITVVLRRMAAGETFDALDVANEILGGRGTVLQLSDVSSLVGELWEQGRYGEHDYRRVKGIDGNVRYQLNKAAAKRSAAAAVAPAPPPPKAAPAPSPPVIAPPKVSPPRPTPAAPADTYAASEILGLSAAELRRRALRVKPWLTAFIGRTDLIPPQTDERTAIIDRGLMLRGLLTREQLDKIHRIGDLWLKFRHGALLADQMAKRSGEQAVADLERARADKKAEKKRAAAERKARRAAEIEERKRTDIVYLGPGVSSQLHDRRSNVEELGRRGLPVLSTPRDLADALGVTVPTLRWLSFHGDAIERPHYVTFSVPKRSGGTRLLASPKKSLRRAQRWVLENILAKLPTEPEAHGFIEGRSTVTCATPHLGRRVVVNLDLSDFFPTITFHRVRGVFARLGYSPAVATILALLCTESPRRAVTVDGRRFFAAVAARSLPQGACTSPALSNQIAKRLDRRLAGMSRKHGLVYTRYADDLTFSTNTKESVAMLLARVRHVVGEEGFALNPKKGRVQRKGRRQTVTGIVVNQKLGLPREDVRKLRAILHNAKKTGLEGQNREGLPHFEAHLRGKIAYLHMVDPQKAAPLLAQLDALAPRP